MIPRPWARFTWAWSIFSSSSARSSRPREEGLADAEFVPIADLPRSLGRVRDLVTDLHRRLPASSVRDGI